MHTRNWVRWVHLFGALSLGTLVYSPLIDSRIFLLLNQWLTVPVLTCTGIWMWKGQYIRNYLLRSKIFNAVLRMSFAEKLTLVVILIALLHHTDHVLRVDHSGWPFTDRVNPFTYSLMVYPAVLGLLIIRNYPKTRVVLTLLLFLFPTLAHIFIETPMDQFSTWQNPLVNMLNIESPMAGYTAATITITLSTLSLVAVFAYLREWRNTRTEATQHSD